MVTGQSMVELSPNSEGLKAADQSLVFDNNNPHHLQSCHLDTQNSEDHGFYAGHPAEDGSSNK
jgi:hypothetical protein